MIFWSLAAILTLLAITSAVWPLLARPKPRATALDHDRAIYRARIAEIDHDLALGRIGVAEAEAAKSEEGRKLIAASSATQNRSVAPSEGLKQSALVAAFLAVPIAAVLLYVSWGSPAMPDMAIAARGDRDLTQQSLEQLVSRAEAQLAKNPNDIRGWKVLAPIYLSMGRMDDAVIAWRNALRIEPDNIDSKGALAETLVAAGQGVVTEEARALFAEQLAARPGDPKSRFYLAMALGQQGDLSGAEAAWRGLIADSPPDAAWLQASRARLDEILSKAGKPAETAAAAEPAPQRGPTQEDIAAAGNMAPEDRQAMIEGMVSGLAERLKADPSDKGGWLKLIRAYVVMGDGEKAAAALGEARKAHGTDAQFAAELAALEAEMGKAGGTQ
jgi:cytochrome c-type biogenesis protein CcmH